MTRIRAAYTLNRALAAFFLVLMIVANVTGWVNSITFIAQLSLVALILPPLSAGKVEQRLMDDSGMK